jgi:hypothetical protein
LLLCQDRPVEMVYPSVGGDGARLPNSFPSHALMRALSQVSCLKVYRNNKLYLNPSVTSTSIARSNAGARRYLGAGECAYSLTLNSIPWIRLDTGVSLTYVPEITKEFNALLILSSYIT